MTTEPDQALDFAAWVRPHLPAMGYLAARLAGSADRDDVAQEALVRAWRKRQTFDPARGTARVWLLAIVADRAARTRRRRRDVIPLSGERASAVAPADAVHLELEEAVSGLAPRMRLAVDCFYFVDLTITRLRRSWL